MNPQHAPFGDLKVSAVVSLPTSTLTLDDLSQLQPGAVVRLALRSPSPVELVVNGFPIAEGQIVTVSGVRAIAITEIP